jgi:hypothetical protein
LSSLREWEEKLRGGVLRCAASKPNSKAEITHLKVGHYKGHSERLSYRSDCGGEEKRQQAYGVRELAPAFPSLQKFAFSHET